MPIEFKQLRMQDVPIDVCPVCMREFVPAHRGCVQRSRRSPLSLLSWIRGKRFHYCALICAGCGEIVGYESPDPWFVGFPAIDEFARLE